MKIGLIGAGHLGKIHLKLLKEIPFYDLIGFYDADPQTLKSVAEQYQVKAFEHYEDLVNACDVVDIVAPTPAHYSLAEYAIKRGRHAFIEKPVTLTVEEAKALRLLALEAGVLIQVGHVERFNPAFIAALPYVNKPMFIEIHRLAQYNPRGTDVSVVLDLMIHDIDLVLSLVKSNIKKISANGMNVVSDGADLANARLEFDNGCVVNITTSRVSLKNMRRMRVFQGDAYITIDLLEKKTEVLRIKNAGTTPNEHLLIDPGHGKEKKELYFEHPAITPINAIQTELTAFYESIHQKKSPPVSIDDAILALNLAILIEEKIKQTIFFQ